MYTCKPTKKKRAAIETKTKKTQKNIETKTKIYIRKLFLPALLSSLCVKQLQQRLQQERLEETFAQQMDEMESLYGGALIVSMPSDTLQRDHFTGSTRSSLSSYSEG